MSARTISTADAPQAIGPYSQAVDSAGVLFVSGQIALDASGVVQGADVKDQTKQVLKNLTAIIKAAGFELSHVVKTTVYMIDLGRFAEMNDVYASTFAAPFPARATVQVSALPKGALVEIDAICKK